MTQTPTPTPPSPSGEATARPLRRGLRALLFVSLAANVLVIGLVIGAVLDGPKDRKVPRTDRIGGPMTFALTHDDRHAIGRELRREYRRDRPNRAQLQAEYQGVVAALRANPFQIETIQSSLQRQRDAANERLLLGHEILLKRIQSMTPQARADFADRMEEGLARDDKRGFRDGPSGKGPSKNGPPKDR